MSETQGAPQEPETPQGPETLQEPETPHGPETSEVPIASEVSEAVGAEDLSIPPVEEEVAGGEVGETDKAQQTLTNGQEDLKPQPSEAQEVLEMMAARVAETIAEELESLRAVASALNEYLPELAETEVTPPPTRPTPSTAPPASEPIQSAPSLPPPAPTLPPPPPAPTLPPRRLLRLLQAAKNQGPREPLRAKIALVTGPSRSRRPGALSKRRHSLGSGSEGHVGVLRAQELSDRCGKF